MDTNDTIVLAAISLGAKYGIKNVTRRMVAAKARVSEGLVSHYLGGRDEMRAVIKRQMKKARLNEPTAEQIAAHGIKLRKRKPRKPRDLSLREIKAIKRKAKP